jgi:hypothetical protein
MKVKRLLEVGPPSAGSKKNVGFARVDGILWVSLWITLAATASLRAGPLSSDQVAASAASSSITESDKPQSTRYGLFDLLDHRSDYGQGVFPEPFLVDDSDLEVNEARLDWETTQRNSQHNNLITGEVEKGFGLLTLEVEVPFEHNYNGNDVENGFANIDLGARVPIYQYVSSNGFLDSTFGVGIEVGIPTNSTVSKNAELVPKVFNDLRLGSHFTLQSVFGYSMLYGPGEDGGLDTFEYGFVFGWTIPHSELPIPGVLQLIPMLELNGETALNHAEHGSNSLIGDLGVRVNTKPIGSIQPRLGVAFVFPVDRGARDDVHWGVVTSLVFEY